MKRYSIFPTVNKGCYAVWDSLTYVMVLNSEKANATLAQAAADRMNADYELAMERQRKKLFKIF